MIQVYIGYDREEDKAAQIAKASLLDHAKVPVNVTFLKLDMLRRAGLYTRHAYMHKKQRFDTADHKPFSTEFSFTRFLVPALSQWQGEALFMDSDVLLREDIGKLFATWKAPEFAIRCVKHAYTPTEEKKLRGGVAQQPYERKNWSSVLMFNCGHPVCQMLTPHVVNTYDGLFLQSLQWCPEQYIGDIGHRWNWLEGHSPADVEPALVHYTRGTPDVPGYENAPYADEWWGYYNHLEEAA